MSDFSTESYKRRRRETPKSRTSPIGFRLGVFMLSVAIIAVITALTIVGCGDPLDPGDDKFATYTLSTGAFPEGAGEVRRDPDQEAYQNGTEVQLTAVPVSGYRLAGWFGPDTSLPAISPIKFIVRKNATLFANFEEDRYTLTVGSNLAAGGTAEREPSLTTYRPGDTVVVTARAASGYVFIGWSGDSESKDSAITIIMTTNFALTANFRSSTHTLTVGVNPTGVGTVHVNGVVSMVTIQGHGVPVNIEAIVGPGYRFVDWTATTGTDGEVVFGDINSRITTVTLGSDATVTANFRKTFALTVVDTAGGSVLVDDVSYTTPMTLDSGTAVTLRAMPDSGYRFDKWSGASTSAEAAITVAMNGDLTLTPIFRRTYKVTVGVNTEGAGAGTVFINDAEYTVPVVMAYDSGTVAGIKAAAVASNAEEYRFVKWLGASTSVKDTVTLTFTISGDTTLPLTASFEPIFFVDIREDGEQRRYRTVRIGDMVWMAENLAAIPRGDHYRCYNDNTSNCEKYGRLYDWHTAMVVCPDRYRLPTDEDWEELIQFAGGTSIEAAEKLKAKAGLVNSENGLVPDIEGGGWANNSGGTDDYGFSALPGGRFYFGGYEGLSGSGYWWSTTENSPWSVNINHNIGFWPVIMDGPSSFISVRCIRE